MKRETTARLVQALVLAGILAALSGCSTPVDPKDMTAADLYGIWRSDDGDTTDPLRIRYMILEESTSAYAAQAGLHDVYRIYYVNGDGTDMPALWSDGQVLPFQNAIFGMDNDRPGSKITRAVFVKGSYYLLMDLSFYDPIYDPYHAAWQRHAVYQMAADRSWSQGIDLPDLSSAGGAWVSTDLAFLDVVP